MPTETSSRASVVAPAKPDSLAGAALDLVVRPHPAGGCYLAVVHTADAISFRGSALDRDDLVELLADYVSTRASDRLWPRDADRVRSLLACGERDAAIASYFARVGQRWDKEWLITTVVGASD